VKFLFDQGTPVPLRRLLPGHDVSIAYEMGWSTLMNGELLAAAETAGFAAIVTTDKNIRHQQSVAGRRFGILVLPTTDWSKSHVDRTRRYCATPRAVPALRPTSRPVPSSPRTTPLRPSPRHASPRRGRGREQEPRGYPNHSRGAS
jgi:predicted nuclease of predicted toxin-antitoxin system